MYYLGQAHIHTSFSDATKDRFIGMYHVTDKAPSRSRELFNATVLELVKLIQAALAIFGMFDITSEERDGLLCDITCEGIQRWVTEIGEPYLHIEVNRPCMLHVPEPLRNSCIVAHGAGRGTHGHRGTVQSNSEHTQQAACPRAGTYSFCFCVDLAELGVCLGCTEGSLLRPCGIRQGVGHFPHVEVTSAFSFPT